VEDVNQQVRNLLALFPATALVTAICDGAEIEPPVLGVFGIML
jgi:hypothetical protein